MPLLGTTATATVRRAERRRRAQARLAWFLHKKGVVILSHRQLARIHHLLRLHHSRDSGFLRAIIAAMSDNAPWRCISCKQLRKHTATYCQICQLPWQQAIDRTYVHQAGGHQQSTYAPQWPTQQQQWNQQQYPQGWNRPRSKSRTHTPRGRRSKSNQSRQQAEEGKGHQVQMQSKGKGKGKEALAPLPPPQMPWPGYGMPGPAGPQVMMMPNVMAPPMTPMPMMQTMAPMTVQPPQGNKAPVAPAFSAPPPPQHAMDSEHKEFMEMARARQMELPPDLRQKVQQLTKREGAQATKDLHSAVRHLGAARSELEEALQARSNLISSWKCFLTDAIRTWQDFTDLFQKQERDLQERIQQAQMHFNTAKEHAAQSQEEAGKITTIEIKDDEEELAGEQANNDNSSGKIHAGLVNLSTSLQQLREQADAIEVQEKAAKRARTVSPEQGDQNMDEHAKKLVATDSKGSFA